MTRSSVCEWAGLEQLGSGHRFSGAQFFQHLFLNHCQGLICHWDPIAYLHSPAEFGSINFNERKFWNGSVGEISPVFWQLLRRPTEERVRAAAVPLCESWNRRRGSPGKVPGPWQGPSGVPAPAPNLWRPRGGGGFLPVRKWRGWRFPELVSVEFSALA